MRKVIYNFFWHMVLLYRVASAYKLQYEAFEVEQMQSSRLWGIYRVVVTESII